MTKTELKHSLSFYDILFYFYNKPRTTEEEENQFRQYTKTAAIEPYRFLIKAIELMKKDSHGDIDILINEEKQMMTDMLFIHFHDERDYLYWSLKVID